MYNMIIWQSAALLHCAVKGCVNEHMAQLTTVVQDFGSDTVR